MIRFIWATKRCFELLGGTHSISCRWWKGFSAGEVRLFATVFEIDKSEEGLDRIVHVSDCCPFLSGLLQVRGFSQNHILLFVSRESSFL